MLERLRRTVKQVTPHDHVWDDRNLGGGLHRSVCSRCGRIAVESVPRSVTVRPESERG